MFTKLASVWGPHIRDITNQPMAVQTNGLSQSIGQMIILSIFIFSMVKSINQLETNVGKTMP